MLKRNEGNLDRILRVVAGLALLGWYFFAGGPVWALIVWFPWHRRAGILPGVFDLRDQHLQA